MSDINSKYNKCASKLYTCVKFFDFFLLWSAVVVHNSENRTKIPMSNPNFQKTRIFKLTKFIYVGLIPDMPNIHSEISPPIK